MLTASFRIFIILSIMAMVLSYRTFAPRNSFAALRHHSLSMGKGEYIPDGLSKEEWLKMKKQEGEKEKGKNLAAVGITKFKSKSFEAWQKSGMGYLFPTDPKKTPADELPYMMRKGGSADGDDLRKKGLKGKGQGKFVPKTAVDKKYEEMDERGESVMFPFNIVRAYSVPWNSNAPQDIRISKTGKALEGKEPVTSTTTKSQNPFLSFLASFNKKS